jgi:hypothetical protein
MAGSVESAALLMYLVKSSLRRSGSRKKSRSSKGAPDASQARSRISHALDN